jgi:Mitochondrial carrier protein
VAASEGILGFYRGFAAVVVGSVPGSMAYFGAFEAAKVLLPPDSGVGGGLLTGALAQLAGGLIFTPMDIIKERLQV